MKAEGSYVRLGDIAVVIRGVTYKKAEASDRPAPFLVPILRATNISAELDFENLVYVPESRVRADQRLQRGDIVLAASSGSLNVVGKAAGLKQEWEGSFGAFCYVVRADLSVVRSRYLELFMQSSAYRNRVAKLAAGTNINNLKREHIRSFEVSLPTLEAQDVFIAGAEKQLTRLDAGIAGLQRGRAQVQRYSRSLLHAATTGALTAKPAFNSMSGHELLEKIRKARRQSWEENEERGSVRKIYAEPAAANEFALPALPDGWVWASMEEITMKIVDGVHKKPDYAPDGIPFVTVRSLTAGPGVDLEQGKFISVDDHLLFSKRAPVAEGDLLISKDGTLGVIRQVRTAEPMSVFVSVILAKPVLRELSNYLELALKAPLVQQQMVPKGSGLQHIHLEDFRRDCVPIPPPETMQSIVEEIAAKESVIRRVDEEISQGLKRAGRLRYAILGQVFSGASQE